MIPRSFLGRIHDTTLLLITKISKKCFTSLIWNPWTIYFLIFPLQFQFTSGPAVPDELDYESAVSRLSKIAGKSNLKTSFIGDALPHWQTHPIVEFVSKLRPLSTSYTPYQPERSQGTLVTHWIYQCALASLTGFEAINTSLYDRSAAIFEAITCAIRTNKKGGVVLLGGTLFDSEVKVINTLSEETSLKFISCTN